MSCTTILIGKAASYDGSTIVARNDDSGHGKYDPKRFVAVRPEDQPRRYVSEISHAVKDLPDDPCLYSIVPNALPGRGILAEAGASVRNVAMSATETIAVNERVLAADPMVALVPAVGEPGEEGYRPEQPGGIGEEDFITLVLPYVHTAREGVERLGALLERYGTYEANGIAISDVDEIWYVETIGGHHWIARRVPDDCYAAIPNQLGLDDFDLEDALGDQKEHMCSADMREFIETNHLDVSMDADPRHLSHLNPRALFGTRTDKDHIYNTPRAWYMQRYLNPSDDWDSPNARYTPISDDIPWCRRPENKVSIEDVDFLMSSHFEGTPYDPYGTRGTEETRRRYRPIGINRNGQLVALQIRPYAPEGNRSVMWISYGSNPFTSLAPFYANVTSTPDYLANTTGEVTTDSFYWTNRIIAALADPHYQANRNDIEHYREDVLSFGHRLVAATDAAVDSARADASVNNITRSEEPYVVSNDLADANQAMADYLRARTQQLLGSVLYTSSNLMRNAFSMSDR
ncbi:C69 family dipeptidase [Bifidobacterium moraviense]|nr:C69 family dipeptidase [Bifidobacterium sp. DSM 109958]